MSSAFLKKSLELVDSDFRQNNKVLHRQGNAKVYTQLRIINKKKKTKNLRGAADVKKKNIEAIEKIRREHRRKVNKNANKRKLKLLHKPVNEKLLTKILDHIGAPKTEPKKKGKDEEKTAFTEEDFAKFEKEYVFT